MKSPCSKLVLSREDRPFRAKGKATFKETNFPKICPGLSFFFQFSKKKKLTVLVLFGGVSLSQIQPGHARQKRGNFLTTGTGQDNLRIKI